MIPDNCVEFRYTCIDKGTRRKPIWFHITSQHGVGGGRGEASQEMFDGDTFHLQMIKGLIHRQS